VSHEPRIDPRNTTPAAVKLRTPDFLVHKTYLCVGTTPEKDPGYERNPGLAEPMRESSDVFIAGGEPVAGELLFRQPQKVLVKRFARKITINHEMKDATEDVPLPIGEGQTISQPCIVAAMTAALGLSVTERVLETGTGCG
jgi:hypothetical protein